MKIQVSKSKTSEERKHFERTMAALFQVKKSELAEKLKKKPRKGKD